MSIASLPLIKLIHLHFRSLSPNELKALQIQLNGLPLNNGQNYLFLSELNGYCNNCISIDFNATDFKLLQSSLSFNTIHNCSMTTNMIKDKCERTNRNKFEIVNDEDVSFKMLRSNETLLEQELDKLRNKPTKFICLNDNFDHGTNRTQELRLKQILNQIYQSLFPI